MLIRCRRRSSSHLMWHRMLMSVGSIMLCQEPVPWWRNVFMVGSRGDSQFWNNSAATWNIRKELLSFAVFFITLVSFLKIPVLPPLMILMTKNTEQCLLSSTNMVRVHNSNLIVNGSMLGKLQGNRHLRHIWHGGTADCFEYFKQWWGAGAGTGVGAARCRIFLASGAGAGAANYFAAPDAAPAPTI